MLATVLGWLTDFLTRAIMESRKAAGSKAVASPPPPPLIFTKLWLNEVTHEYLLKWIIMMQSSPCNICNLRADCLFGGYAGRKNRFVCIANLEQTIGKCYICPILPEDVLSVKFATGGNRENSFRKRRLNNEGKKKGTALSFSSPLAHSFFRCLPARFANQNGELVCRL